MREMFECLGELGDWVVRGGQEGEKLDPLRNVLNEQRCVR